MGIPELVLSVLLLSPAMARELSRQDEPPTKYLDNLVISQTMDIAVCLANVNSRAGSFALYPPSDNAVNMVNFQVPINVRIAVNETDSCLLPGGQQYAFFLNFRSLQLSPEKVPVYSIKIDDPSDLGLKEKEPDMSRIDYSLGEFSSHPRSELQYLSKYMAKPSVTLEIRLTQGDFSKIDWTSVVIDYVLLSEGTSEDNAEYLVYCNLLQSYVPKMVYCVDRQSAFMACPANCSSNGRYNPQASLFDAESFSYGSCGREREATKCGEAHNNAQSAAGSPAGPHGRQKVNFILSWDILGGIIGGSVALFILFPMTILCVAFCRRKR